MSPSGSVQELGSVCTSLHCASNRLNMYVCYVIERQSDLDGCTLFLSSVNNQK